MRIFISHDTEDARLASVVKDYLEGIFLNASVFVSGRDLAGGEVWIERLRQTLEEATAIVAIVTRQGNGNRWVLFEAGAGFSAKRTVPLLVDMSFDEVGPPFSLLHARTLDKDGLESLTRDIARLGGVRAPVRFPGIDAALAEVIALSVAATPSQLNPAPLASGKHDVLQAARRATTPGADPQLSALIAKAGSRARELLLRGLARQRESFDVPPDAELAELDELELMELSAEVGLTLSFNLRSSVMQYSLERSLPDDAPPWKKTKLRRKIEELETELDALERSLAR